MSKRLFKLDAPWRVHLGAGRAECWSPHQRDIFSGDDWVHFGEPFGGDTMPKLDWRVWWYGLGDRLPFRAGQVVLVYSEHFLEHLLIRDAVALLEECHRVLRPRGVIRTAVPEVLHGPKREHRGARAHMMRWSAESLSEVLWSAGFEPVPVAWYADSGGRELLSDEELRRHARRTATPELVGDMRYVHRHDSLVVDGVKEG